MTKITGAAMACIAMLIVIAVMRTIYLDADPPTGLSISADVCTDPAQYTHYARNDVLIGESNPFHDVRFSVFQKSSVNMLAFGMFKLFGAGLWQSNAVAVFYSFGALVCFFLVLRRIAGVWAGLIFLVLAGVNYNLTFYGRLPFLEHAVVFWGMLALTIVTYATSPVFFFCAGLSLGVSMFFSKVFGVIFLFPFAVWFAYKFFYESRQNLIRSLALFVAGIGGIGLIWYLWVYMPMSQQVSSYLAEQSLSLYGSPDGLKSVDDFVFKMVTFGDDSELFNRMPIAAFLALIAMMSLGWAMSKKESWIRGFAGWNSGKIFIVAMVVAFYCSLMIWNYRPLRYQLVLIYPIYGLAAMLLADMLRKATAEAPVGNQSDAAGLLKEFKLFPVIIFPLILVLAYKMYDWYAGISYSGAVWDDERVWVYILAIVVTALLVGGVHMVRTHVLVIHRSIAQLLALMCILATAFHGTFNFGYWVIRPSFSNIDNARDLEEILSPGAVLSGPYGPNFSLITSLPSVIHMFGVASIDPWLFRKYPITHLLLDEPNEDLARKNYPEVMSNAAHFRTFFIGNRKVRLFRIAGSTGNPIADSYKLSDLERAIVAFTDGSEAGNEPALRFATSHPNNVSSILLMGERADVMGEVEVAASMFQKAVEISPTNANLYVRAGTFFKDKWLETGDSDMREKAKKYLERGAYFAPNTPSITRSIAELDMPRETLLKSKERDDE